MTRHPRGFTLTDLLTLIVITVACLGILIACSDQETAPMTISNSNADEDAGKTIQEKLAKMAPLDFAKRRDTTERRTRCQLNLRRLSQGLQVYAVSYKDQFPLASTPSDQLDQVTGFASGLRESVDLTAEQIAEMETNPFENSATASLWILARQGFAGTDTFICPASTNQPDPIQTDAGEPMPFSNTWDFAAVDHLSYSTVNMYNPSYKQHWSSNARSSWAILSDNNNATGAERHTLTNADKSNEAKLAELENSFNHAYKGQVFAFGDGHTKFFPHPFVGPANENVFAHTIDGKQGPPSLSTTQQFDTKDCALIPLTGAAGGDTTLDPND